jgi:hypothetical protein
MKLVASPYAAGYHDQTWLTRGNELQRVRETIARVCISISKAWLADLQLSSQLLVGWPHE